MLISFVFLIRRMLIPGSRWVVEMYDGSLVCSATSIYGNEWTGIGRLLWWYIPCSWFPQCCTVKLIILSVYCYATPFISLQKNLPFPGGYFHVVLIASDRKVFKCFRNLSMSSAYKMKSSDHDLNAFFMLWKYLGKCARKWAVAFFSPWNTLAGADSPCGAIIPQASWDSFCNGIWE